MEEPEDASRTLLYPLHFVDRHRGLLCHLIDDRAGGRARSLSHHRRRYLAQGEIPQPFGNETKTARVALPLEIQNRGDLLLIQLASAKHSSPERFNGCSIFGAGGCGSCRSVWWTRTVVAHAGISCPLPRRTRRVSGDDSLVDRATAHNPKHRSGSAAPAMLRGGNVARAPKRGGAARARYPYGMRPTNVTPGSRYPHAMPPTNVTPGSRSGEQLSCAIYWEVFCPYPQIQCAPHRSRRFV